MGHETLIDQLNQWLEEQEGEQFEFKEAKNKYSSDKLAKYSSALANEGGGRIVLGVTDSRPRKVVGTNAFKQPDRTRRTLMEKIPLRIDCLEIPHPDGRVLVFEVPSHPIGTPIKYEGRYWSREADSLVPLSEDKLRIIFSQGGHDFSAEVCHGAGIQDLDSNAIENFRRRWTDKSKNKKLAALSKEQLLTDAEVLLGNGLTYAALILFGSKQALGKYLGQAEIVFEYRSSNASGPAQQRKEFRRGFFSCYEELWDIINLRNDLQHFQEGLFVLDIPTFEEQSVREAILNAVSHRDYQLGGNVFVRQHPRKLIIESPGGFPVGITPDNILDRQSPRNRRIAEVFAKCGLVERSGQGMNLMFERSIQQGKPKPDFNGTDNFNVVLTLYGQVQDLYFVQFLEKVGHETTASFGTHDFLVIDLVHREQPVHAFLNSNLHKLLELGILESIGRGRGTRYILSRRFYASIRKKGTYTRKKGLGREHNKGLILKHVTDNAKDGSKMEDFRQVLPGCTRGQIHSILKELKKENKIKVEGRTRGALWYPRDNN